MIALGLLDPRIPAPLPGSKPVSLLDPDLAAAIKAGNESRALESREQNEEEIASEVRRSLEELYSQHIESRKERSPRTLKFYLREFSAFSVWCLKQHCLPDIEAPRSLPTRPETLASYLHELLEGGAIPGKLRLVVAAVSRAHRLKQFADPAGDPLIAGILKASRERDKKTRVVKRKNSNGVHH